MLFVSDRSNKELIEQIVNKEGVTFRLIYLSKSITTFPLARLVSKRS